MSITYPLTVPNHNFRRWTLRQVCIAALSVSPFTGQQQVQEYEGEFWEVDCETPAMKRAQAETWLAFFHSLRGPTGTFMMGDPLGQTLRGSGLGSPVVDGPHAKQLNYINSRGWTANETGVLLAGDYIGIGTGGNQKMFKVLQDVDADSSGDAVIDIFPANRDGLGDATAINLNNIKAKWRLVSPFTWDANYLQLYGARFTAREAF